MQNSILKFKADHQKKPVSKENQAKIIKSLEKTGQKKILQILSEKDETINSHIFSEFINFDFDCFEDYYKTFKSGQNVISDFSKVRQIQKEFICSKPAASEEEIKKSENIGLELIAKGKG